MSKSTFVSRLRMIGILRIRVRDVATGKVLRTIIKRNTITYDAGDIVRALLAQRATDTPAAQFQFGSMRFGTSSTATSRNDTNLMAEVTAVRRQLTDLEKLNGGSGELTLHAFMEGTAGNGHTYREAGLFTVGTLWSADVGGSLMCFARQLHAAIEKTASVALEYDWTLQFTV